MTKPEADFSAGLFAVALSPERFYEFAEAFNDYTSISDGNHLTRAALDKDHVQKAIQVADLFIEKETSKAKNLRHSIQNANHPVLAVDVNGDIVESNVLALELFALDTLSSSFIESLKKPSQLTLREYLKKISIQSFGTNPHFIELIELEQKNTDRKFFVCLTPWDLDTDTQCLLIQAINIRWPNHMTPLLKKAFGLTTSEIEIFRLIAEGVSVTETATQRKTSVATVRTQIREIYSKTGTKNQLQFIRLAVSLAALTLDKDVKTIPAPEENTVDIIDKSFPKQEHWNLLKLVDGRFLDYAVFGDPKGTPCLFFHNEIMGDVWPEELTQYATKKGLKIILPARPYYRRSSAYPKNVNHLEQTAQDIVYLLDYLNISKVYILAHTLGGMFALHFSHSFHKRVKSLCVLSPMLPFSNAAQQKNMPPLHKFISSLLLNAPWMMEFVGRTAYAFYLKVEPEVFLHKTYSSAPIDKKTLENPHHLISLSRGLTFGDRHGHKAYVAGFKHLIKKPVKMMKDLKMPITVIIGELDQNTRQERANSLIEKGVEMNVVIAPGGGELLAFTHPKLIIDTLLEK